MLGDVFKLIAIQTAMFVDVVETITMMIAIKTYASKARYVWSKSELAS